MRIVVVEDQQELCNVLAKRISWLHDDYEIVGKAYNGLDGLKLIQVTRPDAAFIDIRMPFMDGLELLERLSKEEKQQTKCIILSAYSDFPYTQRSIRSGAFDYLLKPISNSILEEVLVRLADDIDARIGLITASTSTVFGLPQYPLGAYAEKQLNLLIHEKKITDEVVLQVLRIISTEYMHAITLSSLAERLHVSESHLCRIFSRKVGMNLIQFLNSFRINLAKTLMDDTEMKIGDIAKMIGFGNITYFGRLFRKQTSLSASEYKQYSIKPNEFSR
ncbi:response regulator [Paenibacillus sp. V4I5]|uniref:response regulator transcription factor n=1 Tax=Paenibacillus sp. V4I5 TaxID=3042306 RepID=UPI0027937489|nr:response regulator [Paenibacillus sp. V4I5]MDQ0920209.1 two-component system response regulator YesN [Paenibacillus sp. V4I5]